MHALWLGLIALASATVDYTDQVNWAGICTTGTNQSPRDLINPSDKTDVILTISGSNWLSISQDPAITYLWQYQSTGSNSLKIEFTGSLSSGECSVATYTATQFNFHRTSQHPVATVYKTVEMQIHHTLDSEYSSCTNMKARAVLGVLFEEDALAYNNQFLERVGIYGGDREYRALFKANLYSWFDVSEGVFFYQGSRTIPNCQQDVFWFIPNKVQSLSARQKLFFDGMGSTASRRDIQTPASLLYLLPQANVRNGQGSERKWWFWPAIFIPLGLLVAGITALIVLIINCKKKRKERRRKALEKAQRRIHGKHQPLTRDDGSEDSR